MTIFQGKVVSIKNKDTATIVVRRRARHPLYGKAITKTKKYHVHVTMAVQVDDEVRFAPCRPVSKTKRWIVVGMAKKSGGVSNQETNKSMDQETKKPRKQESKKSIRQKPIKAPETSSREKKTVVKKKQDKKVAKRMRVKK